MGNSSSISSSKEIFKKELDTISKLINNIINDKDVFINENYNFLSKNTCKNYKIIFESELKKHMKINIDKLGSSLYVIPNDEDLIKETKKEVCKNISSHYVKILYILSLIKYVYNIEKYGDLSISGIIFRNIVILDDIMEINYCDAPHRDYSSKSDNHKLDFSQLEGFSFFVNYFLDRTESASFIKLFKILFETNNKQNINNKLCEYSFNKEIDSEIMRLYYNKFNEKLKCNNIDNNKKDIDNKYNLLFYVGKNNPILSKLYCYAHKKIIFKINTKEGKKIYNLYLKMKKNYDNNISKIHNILNKIILHNTKENKYELKDIDKKTLDNIIKDVKNIIIEFYLNSLVDFQILLKEAKKIPKITS